MRKGCMAVAGAAVVLLGNACERKTTVAPPVAEAAVAAAKAATVATHLGFATRVPKDVDLFAAGFHADGMVRGLMTAFVRPETMKAGEMEKFDDSMSYLGDEMFVFIGPGAGGKIRMMGETYRDLSAVWAETVVGTMLDTMEKKNTPPDFSKLGEGVSNKLLDQWLNALEKDSRLQLPTVVLGWKPDAAKVTGCRDAVLRSMDEIHSATTDLKAVKFEASGVAMEGFEITGLDAFGKEIAGIREGMAKNTESAAFLEQISPERVERLLAALENVRFTIATGVVDGRVLIYLGNGPEGFRLAASPAESLAASDDLTWTGGDAGKRIAGTFYLSETMVASVLPLLDSSESWEAVSRAIRPPVRDERLFRDLLNGLADTERELSKRDASAWSAVLFADDGLHIETRGGWPDPSLDYVTPLKMTEAAGSQKPAVRAHWIQQRGRNDLAWKRLEYFGVLADSVIGEMNAAQNPMMAVVPEGVLPRITSEISGLNRAYREEFRAGIGDEVAVIADFQGEVPPVPGISEETVKNAKAPRFIIARPVRDRAKLDAAGKSLVQSWRSLTAWASEQSGENLPLIVPQSIESGGLVTWYPPLPFIGGDFMPGVTMNNELWMLGTSRSMAGGFAKSMARSSSGGETGMIVEIDFPQVREWFADFYQRNEAEAKEITKDARDEMMEIARKESIEPFIAGMHRLQGLSYHHWMSGGKPRTSLHIRVGPAQ